MKTFRGRTFTGQRVLLDGKQFIECKFANCTLVIEGKALFQMEQSHIDADCKLAVESEGKNTLDMLKLMLYGGGWLAEVADAVLNRVREPPRYVGKEPPATEK